MWPKARRKNEVTVRQEVSRERLFQVGCRDKAFGAQNLSNATIEALYHPVGLRMTQLDEPSTSS